MQQSDLFPSPPWTPIAPRRAPREKGKQAGEACVEKAVLRADFDPEGAAKFIVGWLVRYGNTKGETLTDEAKKHGYRPHDDRAFGPVYAGLVRRNLIRCVGYCERIKGNGTAGGRVWSIVR